MKKYYYELPEGQMEELPGRAYVEIKEKSFKNVRKLNELFRYDFYYSNEESVANVSLKSLRDGFNDILKDLATMGAYSDNTFKQLEKMYKCNYEQKKPRWAFGDYREYESCFECDTGITFSKLRDSCYREMRMEIIDYYCYKDLDKLLRLYKKQEGRYWCWNDIEKLLKNLRLNTHAEERKSEVIYHVIEEKERVEGEKLISRLVGYKREEDFKDARMKLKVIMKEIGLGLSEDSIDKLLDSDFEFISREIMNELKNEGERWSFIISYIIDLRKKEKLEGEKNTSICFDEAENMCNKREQMTIMSKQYKVDPEMFKKLIELYGRKA